MGFFWTKWNKIQQSSDAADLEDTKNPCPIAGVRTLSIPKQGNFTSGLEPSSLFIPIPETSPSEPTNGKPWFSLRDLFAGTTQRRRKFPRPFRLRRNRNAETAERESPRNRKAQTGPNMPVAVSSAVVTPTEPTLRGEEARTTTSENICTTVRESFDDGASLTTTNKFANQERYLADEQVEGTDAVKDAKGKEVEKRSCSPNEDDDSSEQMMKWNCMIQETDHVQEVQFNPTNGARPCIETNSVSNETRAGHIAQYSSLDVSLTMADSQETATGRFSRSNASASSEQSNRRRFTGDVTIRTPTGDRPAKLLYDTGSDDNFIGDKFCELHGLIQRPLFPSDIDEYKTASGYFVATHYVDVEMQNKKLGTPDFKKESFLVVSAEDLDLELLVGSTFMSSHGIDLHINGKRLLVIAKRASSKAAKQEQKLREDNDAKRRQQARQYAESSTGSSAAGTATSQGQQQGTPSSSTNSSSGTATRTSTQQGGESS